MQPQQKVRGGMVHLGLITSIHSIKLPVYDIQSYSYRLAFFFWSILELQAFSFSVEKILESCHHIRCIKCKTKYQQSNLLYVR